MDPSVDTGEREQPIDARWEWRHISAARNMPPPGTLATALCGARFRPRGFFFTQPRADHCPLCVAVGTQQGRW